MGGSGSGGLLLLCPEKALVVQPGDGRRRYRLGLALAATARGEREGGGGAKRQSARLHSEAGCATGAVQDKERLRYLRRGGARVGGGFPGQGTCPPT